MTELSWVREDDPVWDADKRRVIGGAPDGAFVIPFRDGEPVPGEWWSVREEGEDGQILAYARLDIGWGGDAQILLAVDPARQEEGVGSFVLARLEDEAAARGINYVYNTIREHEQRDLVHDWLVVRGFRGRSTATCASGSAADRPHRPARPARAARRTTWRPTRAGGRPATRSRAGTSTSTSTATDSHARCSRRCVRVAGHPRPRTSPTPAAPRCPTPVAVVEGSGGAWARPVVVEQLARQVGVEEREATPGLDQLDLGHEGLGWSSGASRVANSSRNSR